MATVWIPSLMRDLTAGQAKVVVEGRTLGAVIDALERAYPGVKERLLRGGKLDPALHALVDGRVALLGLGEPVAQDGEVRIIPAIAGG
jgi:molybdopterin synthase sulfur carrier subunit